MLALLPVEPPEVDTLPLERGEGRPVEGARVGLVERVEASEGGGGGQPQRRGEVLE